MIELIGKRALLANWSDGTTATELLSVIRFAISEIIGNYAARKFYSVSLFNYMAARLKPIEYSTYLMKSDDLQFK